jgi:hypothetical protein
MLNFVSEHQLFSIHLNLFLSRDEHNNHSEQRDVAFILPYR